MAPKSMGKRLGEDLSLKGSEKEFQLQIFYSKCSKDGDVRSIQSGRFSEAKWKI